MRHEFWWYNGNHRLLKTITNSLLRFVKSRKSLSTTSGTCLFLNVTASDQYLAIVVPGRMFANSYKKYGLDPKNLSRTLEDTAVTSPLVLGTPVEQHMLGFWEFLH